MGRIRLPVFGVAYTLTARSAATFFGRGEGACTSERFRYTII